MVLELEVASFELASLELAGGLYANDCNLTAHGNGALDARVATVHEGEANAAGLALLVLDGQMAGTVQADMNCVGASNVLASLQAIGATVTASHSQSITGLSLQAYGAMVAQSYGMSGVTYAAGAYATTAQQSYGYGTATPTGQSVFQSIGTLLGSASLSGNGQAVNLSRFNGQGLGAAALSLNAYGDQRLTAAGASELNQGAARVRQSIHAITGTGFGIWRIGAFATTEIRDAAGDFEMADFELGMSELGGEAIRYGAAHAEMLCFGQAIAKTNLSAGASVETQLLPAYALQSIYSAAGSAATNWRFSAYGDIQTRINGVSVALCVAPNARLFRLLPHAYDTSARAYESRGTLRPVEIRCVKRPLEPRLDALPVQPRTVSWS